MFGAGDDDGVVRFNQLKEGLCFFGVAFFAFNINAVERQVDVAQAAASRLWLRDFWLLLAQKQRIFALWVLRLGSGDVPVSPVFVRVGGEAGEVVAARDVHRTHADKVRREELGVQGVDALRGKPGAEADKDDF